MDRRGFWLPLGLAVAAAIVYLAALTQQQRRLTGDYEPVKVLVARTDLPERTALTEELVRTESVPRRFAAQDAFEVRSASDIKMIRHLVTRIRIPKGNQVTQSAVLPLSPGSGLSVKVPPGYRGAILPVNRELTALTKPGDRVDVLLTFEALFADARKKKATATLLQNVLVLAVGDDLGQGLASEQFNRKQESENRAAAFSESGFLSVALNPLETQYLALAMEQGKLFVALRNVGDDQMHPIQMSTLDKLFGP